MCSLQIPGIYNDGINGFIIREDDFVNLDFRSQLTDIVAFVSGTE